MIKDVVATKIKKDTGIHLYFFVILFSTRV